MDFETYNKIEYVRINFPRSETYEEYEKMIDTDDDELFDTCIDSLRSFSNVENAYAISQKTKLKHRIEQRLNTADNVSKAIYGAFMDRFFG
ncbi:MAG: hypothetical protein LBG71_05050 [Clostridiales Family XIII bacterium]|jgi:hypothetical protein|nr:hypothetical protein [Clostridiales Family XIII bacterium]